jgi:hypothetical protein
MAARLLPPHRFVCLTDRPQALTGVTTIMVDPLPEGMYGWWRKVELFNPRHPLGGRLLYLDLDVLIVSDMRRVLEFPASFALAPDGAPNFKPRDRNVVHKYNSSVMVWNGGEQSRLYSEWSPKVAERLWGDQDWIGEKATNAIAMPIEWFPRLSQVSQTDPPDIAGAEVILCKKPKNVDAATKWPWFAEAWR